MKDGWEYRKLGKVSSFQNGFAFKSNLFRKEGCPIVRISNIQNEEIITDDIVYFNKEDYPVNFDNYKILPNDILIAMSGGTTGKLGINTTNIIFYQNQRVGVIREDKTSLNHRFLFYFLHTKSEESLKIAAGAAQPNLSTAQIKEFVIPLPSLSEQQSIVEYLDSAFAKIDAINANAEKALNEAKALFQASLKEMLEPKEGWDEKKIKDVGSVIGGTTPNTNVKEYWDGTLCWISPAELDGSHYLYDSRKKITETAVKAKSLKLLPEGTVILSSRAPIGKVVINKVPTYCNQGFKCVVCGKEIYNEFLYWWFWGKTDYLNSLGTGATFKEISKKVVEEISIPVPPLADQQSIVDYLDSLKSKVDRLQENFDKISQECDALKQAVLRQVFE